MDVDASFQKYRCAGEQTNRELGEEMCGQGRAF